MNPGHQECRPIVFLQCVCNCCTEQQVLSYLWKGTKNCLQLLVGRNNKVLLGQDMSPSQHRWDVTPCALVDRQTDRVQIGPTVSILRVESSVSVQKLLLYLKIFEQIQKMKPFILSYRGEDVILCWPDRCHVQQLV